jgi:hypothetical protein
VPSLACGDQTFAAQFVRNGEWFAVLAVVLAEDSQAVSGRVMIAQAALLMICAPHKK